MCALPPALRCWHGKRKGESSCDITIVQYDSFNPKVSSGQFEFVFLKSIGTAEILTGWDNMQITVWPQFLARIPPHSRK